MVGAIGAWSGRMKGSTWLILALGLAVVPGIGGFGQGSTEQAVTGARAIEPWTRIDLTPLVTRW